MVSAEVEAPSKRMPNLGAPIRKFFSLLPLLAALVLVGFGLVYFLRSEAALDNRNQNLQGSSVLPLSTTTQVAPVLTDTPAPTPTRAVSPTATLQPTATEEPLVALQVPATQEPSCMDALSVTAEYAGQTLCIQGQVYSAEQKEGVFTITFSKEWGNFYLLSYDRVWKEAQPGACIQVTGEIVLSGTIPVIVFGYHNDLSLCP